MLSRGVFFLRTLCHWSISIACWMLHLTAHAKNVRNVSIDMTYSANLL